MITWDFVAGFTLADGCIQWLDKCKEKGRSAHATIILAQVYKEPLEAIQQFLLMEGLNPTLYQRKKPDATRKPLWILAISRQKDVIEFLEATQGLLFQKKERAEFILDKFYEKRKVLNAALKLHQSGIPWWKIRQETGVGQKALIGHFRAEGIELKVRRGKPLTEWRKERIEQGLCTQCGKSRGIDGTKWHCRQCADKRNELTTKWRRKQIEAGLCRECGKERGLNGTITMCHKCADAKKGRQRRYASHASP